MLLFHPPPFAPQFPSVNVFFTYNAKQTSYENLVDQVTNLLEERPDDLTAIAKARNLQDNINSIYDR